MRAWCSFLVILILAASLRFYNVEKRFIFTLDEEYQSTLAQTIVKDFHVIWIGVSVANLGFYLGPGWTYFTALWQFISHGDPAITAYVAATLGVVTTALTYLVGKSLFGHKTGLMAELLYATLPLIVFWDQRYLNLSLIPALSLIILWSLVRGQWWLFGLAFGLVFHTHMSLFPAIFPAILALYLKRKNLNFKSLILGVILFVVTISPMVVFDIVHKFSNVSTPLRWNQIVQNPSTRVNPILKIKSLYTLLSRLVYLAPGREIADEVLFACSPIPIHASESLDVLSTWTKPLSIFSVLILIMLMIFIFRKDTWQTPQTMILAVLIFAVIISYIFVPSNAFEYYLLPVFPLILFIPGLIRNKNTKLLCILFAVLGIFTVMNARDSFGIAVKKELVHKTMAILGDSPFDLREIGGCQRWSGWRYLFSVYGKAPAISSTDQSLGWLYTVSNVTPRFTVRILESRQTPDFDTNKSVRIEEGGYVAYVDRN